MHKLFNSFPVINLDTIILRELAISDVKDFYSYITHPEVARFLADEDAPKSKEEAVEELLYWLNLYRHKRSIYWGIAEGSSNKLIGTCGFNNWNPLHKRAEVSYDLARAYWGRGIMTHALREICNFAFNKMEVHRIQATVAYDNAGSLRVLEKLGFIKEGLMKKYCILQGLPTDYYMLSLVR